MRRSRAIEVGLGLAALVALAVVLVYCQHIGLLPLLFDGEALKKWIAGLGAYGPLVIIALLMLAIVASPIPSAPIALASGAMYGHLWGTAYVVAGASAGAMIAFGIARMLGREVIRRWLGARVQPGWLGSQNAMMGLVFLFRLLPFLSFDIVSYAAGLTPLRFWRFAVATLAGVAPSSFVLAHFGEVMVSGEANRIMLAVLLVGVLVLLPVLWGMLRDRRGNGDGP